MRPVRADAPRAQTAVPMAITMMAMRVVSLMARIPRQTVLRPAGAVGARPADVQSSVA